MPRFTSFTNDSQAVAPSKPRPRVRLKDISKKADISVAAVSMALADHPTISERTKQRVLSICQEMGYSKPGQNHAALPEAFLQNREIGFVIISRRFDDPTYAPLVHSMAVMAQNRGARVQIGAFDSSNPHTAVAPIMELSKRVDGLIFVGQVDGPLLMNLSELDTPMIVMGMLMHPMHKPLPEKLSLVSPDEMSMGRLATAALLNQGHKRVAYICEIMPTGQSHHQWMQGYQLAHLQAGVPLVPELIHATGRVNSGGEPAAKAFAAMKQPPTAIVVPDAPMARTFLDACASFKLNISAADIICGGHTQRAIEYEVQTCGRIFCESDRLVSSGLDLLTRKMRGEAVSQMSILLHPTCMNFPEGSD